MVMQASINRQFQRAFLFPRRWVQGFYWTAVIRPHLWQFVAVFGLMLAVAMLEMATVGLGVPLLDVAMKSERASENPIVIAVVSAMKMLGLSTTMNMILCIFLVVVTSMAVLRSTCFSLQQYFGTVIAQKLRREFKLAMLTKILEAEYAHLVTKGRGSILFDIDTPARSLYNFIYLTFILLSSMFDGVVLVGLMFYLSWWATLVVGVAGFVWVQVWRERINQKSSECGRQIYALNTRETQIDVDAIDGLKVVKAHGLASSIVRQQEGVLRNELVPRKRLVWLKHGTNSLNEAVVGIVVIGLALITLGWQWASMQFSEIVVFFVALKRLTPILASANSTNVQLRSEWRNVEVIEEILQSTPTEPRGRLLSGRIEELRLVDLSFHYDPRRPAVLKGLNVMMKRGQITAIVGPTGSGKSTLANLLVRLYHPTSGAILVNGTDLEDLDLAAWRRKVGYVPQDVFLFNETLRQNIALWDDAVTQEQVEWAAKLAQIHDFVLSLPERYETVVGDRGVKLSGGQCQRLAIARAILRRPEVLIFDEATSALDNLTEKAVYESIESFRGDTVIVVIAHRLSTIQGADQIVVIQDGRIVENGTHEALMDVKGAYAKLYV